MLPDVVAITVDFPDFDCPSVLLRSTFAINSSPFTSILTFPITNVSATFTMIFTSFLPVVVSGTTDVYDLHFLESGFLCRFLHAQFATALVPHFIELLDPLRLLLQLFLSQLDFEQDAVGSSVMARQEEAPRIGLLIAARA